MEAEPTRGGEWLAMVGKHTLALRRRHSWQACVVYRDRIDPEFRLRAGLIRPVCFEIGSIPAVETQKATT